MRILVTAKLHDHYSDRTVSESAIVIIHDDKKDDREYVEGYAKEAVLSLIDWDYRELAGD